MRLSWRDALAGLFALFGAVIVYAKLNAYSWSLIGSWKGALGLLGVTGLAIVATYFVDWIKNEDMGPVGEIILWVSAATMVVGSLFTTTTKAEFVWSAFLMGAAWLSQFGAHIWDSSHHRPTHFMPAQ